MARRLKDATLDSKDARRRLKIRAKPHYRVVERGLHLGYRRLGGGQAGSWIARYYVGEQEYEVERIGTANDISDADGVHVLDFWQAVEVARKRMVERAHRIAGRGDGALTVKRVVDDYLQYLERERKSAQSARYSIEAHIKPTLGEIEVAKLTSKMIEDWRDDLVKTAARVRTREGLKQKYAKRDGADAKRARKVTANRTLVTLKAALNRAWREGKVTSNTAWSRVTPFKGVNTARMRYLTIAEAKRLINACDPDFRLLVQAALQTGARLGELAALQVQDFNIDSGTVFIRDPKPSKSRHIVLTAEGAAFFKQVCAGRPRDETMLRRADGRAWRRAEQCSPVAEACRRARVTPAASFHVLRHTWASHAVMNGVPLMVVARNMGHRDTRMVEIHYGHLAPSYVADAIRTGAPRFGFKPDKKIATL